MSENDAYQPLDSVVAESGSRWASSLSDMNGDSAINVPSDRLSFSGSAAQDKPTSCLRSRCVQCVIISLLVLIPSVLIVMFVVGPHVAQNLLDKTQFLVGETDLSDANGDSFQMTAHASLDSAVPMKTLLHGSTLTASFGGLAFGKIHTEDLTLDPSQLDFMLIGRLVIENMTIYTEFGSQLAIGSNVTMNMHGSVDVEVMGLFTFGGLRMEQSLTLNALNNLGPVVTQEFTVSAVGDKAGVFVTLSTSNPSDFMLNNLGTVAMDAYVDGHYLMTAQVQNVTLPQGPFTLKAQATLDPTVINNQNPGAITTFTNFLAKQNTTTYVNNSKSSVTIFNPSLQALQLSVNLPGSRVETLLGAYGDFSLLTLLEDLFTHLSVEVPFALIMQNPLDIAVTVTRLHFDIKYQDEVIMTLYTDKYQDKSQLNIVVPANAIMNSKEVPIVAQLGSIGDLLRLFFTELNSGLVFIDTEGEIDVTVADISLTLPYGTTHVPICPKTKTAECDKLIPPHM